jgi:hypothetical protein
MGLSLLFRQVARRNLIHDVTIRTTKPRGIVSQQNHGGRRDRRRLSWEKPWNLAGGCALFGGESLEVFETRQVPA